MYITSSCSLKPVQILAATAAFCGLNRLVAGLRNMPVKRRMLRTRKLDLAAAIDMVRVKAEESADEQVKVFGSAATKMVAAINRWQNGLSHKGGPRRQAGREKEKETVRNQCCRCSTFHELTGAKPITSVVRSVTIKDISQGCPKQRLR